MSQGEDHRRRPTSELEATRRALLTDVASGDCSSVAAHPALCAWPELGALASTAQDPAWHAEGDVLTHTDMVLAEAAQLADPTWSDDDLVALRLAALLHDVAKPAVTRFDPVLARLTARGHERVGGIRARYLLHASGLEHSLRRSVAQLVATHHLAARAVREIDAPDGLVALLRLAERIDTRRLWALDLANARGRLGPDRERRVEAAGLFRMLCEEQSVFGRAPARWLASADLRALPIASERTARWLVAETHRRRLRGELRDPHHALAFCHANARHEPAEVVLTVGPAGSGKSHEVAALDPGFERISPDAEREARYGRAATQGDPALVHGACAHQLRAVLRRGGRAVYDATNVAADLRARLTALCHDYRAYVTLWVFDVPREVLFERNRARARRVPEAVIQRQIDRFEWPLPDEAHATRIIDSGG